MPLLDHFTDELHRQDACSTNFYRVRWLFFGIFGLIASRDVVMPWRNIHLIEEKLRFHLAASRFPTLLKRGKKNKQLNRKSLQGKTSLKATLSLLRELEEKLAPSMETINYKIIIKKVCKPFVLFAASC